MLKGLAWLALALPIVLVGAARAARAAEPPAPVAVVLPQDPAERAFVCEAAVQVGGFTANGRLDFVGATRAGQFEGLRLLAMPDGGFNPDHPRQDWDKKTAAEIKSRTLALLDNHHSPAAVAACDAAYPETLPSFPVVLPQDPDDRFLICEGLIVWIGGKGFWNMSYSEVTPYVGLGKRLSPMFAKFLETRGLKPGPELSRIVVPPIGRALKLGRMDKVLDACVVAFPAA